MWYINFINMYFKSIHKYGLDNNFLNLVFFEQFVIFKLILI
jgi:hypothetical protein